MASIINMSDLDLSNQRVLIRQDLNVPIKNGQVTSDARLLASLPTIKAALEQGAKVLLMSHLGRPTEGGSAEENKDFTLQPVAQYLSNALAMDVPLVADYLQNAPQVESGQVVLLENVRFNIGEKKNEETLAKAYADLCDIFVMDAFGTAHRAQASTYGVAQFAKTAASGPLLSNELENLERALTNPKRPLVAIVGGSKVSTKLTVLENLSEKVDQLIVGGGIANTFLAASGSPVGNSLCEHDLIDQAQQLMEKTQIPIPQDVVVGKEFSEDTPAILKAATDVAEDDMIFDVGPKTCETLQSILDQAGTIIWNGPVGVFEFEQFSQGTQSLSQAIANSQAFSIAGGGDTLAAVDKFSIGDKISYISTGGGAFLEYVEGKVLPAVEILQKRGSE